MPSSRNWLIAFKVSDIFKEWFDLFQSRGEFPRLSKDLKPGLQSSSLSLCSLQGTGYTTLGYEGKNWKIIWVYCVCLREINMMDFLCYLINKYVLSAPVKALRLNQWDSWVPDGSEKDTGDPNVNTRTQKYALQCCPSWNAHTSLIWRSGHIEHFPWGSHGTLRPTT